MADALTRIFWALVVGSVILVWAMGPMPARWAPVAVLLAVGTIFSALNWCIVYSNTQKETRSSLIPLLGGILLGMGISRAPAVAIAGWWPVALIADPTPLLFAWHFASRRWAPKNTAPKTNAPADQAAAGKTDARQSSV